MRIACVQTEARAFDRAGNVAAARSALREAVRDGAGLILLPECFATGYTYDRRLAEASEPLDGPTVQLLRTESRRTGAWMAGGILERSGRAVYGTLVLVAPDGRQWSYRKRFLPFFEKLYLTPGRGVGVFETGLGRIGMMICWDMIHTRPVREMVGRIDLLLIGSAWPDVRTGTLRLPGLEGWLSRPPTSRPRELAATLGVPVAYCNLGGRFETRVPGVGVRYESDFAGCSTVVDRNGYGVVGPRAEQAIVTGDVNLKSTAPPLRVVTAM